MVADTGPDPLESQERRGHSAAPRALKCEGRPAGAGRPPTAGARCRFLLPLAGERDRLDEVVVVGGVVLIRNRAEARIAGRHAAGEDLELVGVRVWQFVLL